MVRAAHLVLSEHGGGPMHYAALTSEITKRRLAVVRGSDPLHSVHSAVCRHIRKREGKSWFELAGGGRFKLTAVGADSQGRFEPTWPAAITRVLLEADGPLGPGEVHRRILQQGLKSPARQRIGSTKGNVGERSVNNLLAEMVREQNVPGVRVLRVGRGTYSAERV